jgi:hypothetical protein
MQIAVDREGTPYRIVTQPGFLGFQEVSWNK